MGERVLTQDTVRDRSCWDALVSGSQTLLSFLGGNQLSHVATLGMVSC